MPTSSRPVAAVAAAEFPMARYSGRSLSPVTISTPCRMMPSRYILKDASEAACAMAGHNLFAESKYLDQVNDAAMRSAGLSRPPRDARAKIYRPQPRAEISRPPKPSNQPGALQPQIRSKPNAYV